jgi:hypothetical protein
MQARNVPIGNLLPVESNSHHRGATPVVSMAGGLVERTNTLSRCVCRVHIAGAAA